MFPFSSQHLLHYILFEGFERTVSFSGRAPDGGCGKRRTYHHPRDCTGGRTRPRHGGLERHCYGMFPALVCDCVAGVGCEPADGKASDCRMTRRVLHSFAFFANEFTWACGPPMGMKIGSG